MTNVPFDRLLPESWRAFDNPRQDLPALARDPRATARIEKLVRGLPSCHAFFLGDSRTTPKLEASSVHLVLTSPPYWTLKAYPERDGQLGLTEDYSEFLRQLDTVWQRCFRALVPGGRMVCIVGDVCLSRRRHGRHEVVPLHAAIQERCRGMGFENLTPIIWHKIANAAYEGKSRGTFLGKPYEPNGIIKNDIEFVLMLRKPGDYRKPTLPAKVLSLIAADLHSDWFRQIWLDVRGASTKNHPAPYPLEVAERLVRMFSFVGDTVLDPFAGTATTLVAAAKWGRNSLGVEVDPGYFRDARRRLLKVAHDTGTARVVVHQPSEGVEVESRRRPATPRP